MSFDDDNIFEIPDEEVVDTPTTEESTDNSEMGEDVKVEQTSETDTEAPNEPENKDKEFLDYLNKKGIKYNGENVEVKSFEDLVSTYQKGMNYDKIKDKTDKEENAVMSYVSEIASKAGLTPMQYIEEVKKYQKQREEEAQQAKIQELVDGHVPKEMAERLVKVEALADQLKAERAELQKQKEEADRKAREDKEFEDFINAYPDVDASKIPDEVFKEAKEIGLTNAYARYENKLLREKINQMEQNKKNASTSVVTNTTDSGGTEQRGEDDFVKALFS